MLDKPSRSLPSELFPSDIAGHRVPDNRFTVPLLWGHAPSCGRSPGFATQHFGLGAWSIGVLGRCRLAGVRKVSANKQASATTVVLLAMSLAQSRERVP